MIPDKDPIVGSQRGSYPYERRPDDAERLTGIYGSVSFPGGYGWAAASHEPGPCPHSSEPTVGVFTPSGALGGPGGPHSGV
jgi:hypothetical protein